MNSKKNVAVIGGGASGLITSWIINEYYDITLFELRPILGGNARTAEIEIENKKFNVDTGFEFFSESMFPKFTRLLKILNVPTEQYNLTYSFWQTHTNHLLFLPPFSKKRWFFKILLPHNFFTLLQFLYFTKKGKKILDDYNTTVTLGQFADSLWLTKRFKNGFLYPLLASGWGDTLEGVKEIAAIEVLTWLQKNKFNNQKFVWTRVKGGIINYINTLSNQIKNVEYKFSTKVTNIKYQNGKYILSTDKNEDFEFDHLIIATAAFNVKELVKDLPIDENVKRKFQNIKSFRTKIAVHSDTNIMPKNRKNWALANVRFNGSFSALTIYKEIQKVPFFRSWITYDKQLPDKLYILEYFEHTRITPDAFSLKKDFTLLQGQNNLWFAGVYTCGVNSHESAITSAINIAKKLAPESEKLKLFN